MDLRKIRSESEWDDVRLGELLDKGKGWQFSQDVIRQIGPQINQCQCVSGLAVYLHQRNVLNLTELCELSQSGTSGRTCMLTVLLKASREPCRGEDLISKLFLALLDMFCDTENSWCHHTAFHVVRERAVEKLGLCSSMSQNIDIAEVISQVPSIEVSIEVASELRRNLHLPNNESLVTNNLKQIVESKSPLSLEDLVRALMLTPRLGRYVTKLLPFHKSYPVDVWHFLILLDKKWVKFALFIGFNEEEVKTIESSAPNSVHEQIKNFFKVWRMPDLTKSNNKKILEEVVALAGITQEEAASQFFSQPFLQEVKGQVHQHFYITVHRDDSTESIPSTPESMPNVIGLPSPSSSRTQINPNSHGGHIQRLHSQQSSSSDLSDVNSPPTTRQLSKNDLTQNFIRNVNSTNNVESTTLPNQMSDTNSDTSGSLEQEQSVSSDVSDEHPPSIAHKRGQKTPNKFERCATCKTRPESTKWTASGSKAKGSSATIRQEHKQSTGGRILPTAPGGQNRQDTKLLQAKREVKPKSPQKVPSVPSGPEKLPHNGRHVKPKAQKAATIPPYRTRPPVPPPKLKYTGRYEAQQYGSPKQGSKTGNEASCHSTLTKQKRPQVPQKPKAPFTRQKQLQQAPTEPHLQLTKDTSSSPENGQDTSIPRDASSMQPQQTTHTCSLQQRLSDTTPTPQAVVKQTAILGYGSYGEVLEVEFSENRFAAKKYNERYAPPAKLHDVFRKEQGIMSKLNHPNVVTYFSICRLSTDGPEVIVMERLQTNFANFMKDKCPALEMRISIMRDVAGGLEYAHTRNPAILHCDLTATNVLITGGRAKIADFGNSRMVDITTPELLQPITRDYMPPEVPEDPIYEKVDVFSFGHLLIYAIIQQQPHPLLKPVYKEDGERKARSEIERRKNYVLQMKEILKDNNYYSLMDLVNTCLNDEPKERPTMDVVSHKLH